MELSVKIQFIEIEIDGIRHLFHDDSWSTIALDTGRDRRSHQDSGSQQFSEAAHL
jgi:hypothetical protein